MLHSSDIKKTCLLKMWGTFCLASRDTTTSVNSHAEKEVSVGH